MDTQQLKRLDWVLAKAEEVEEDLTDWERTFVDGIADKRARHGDALHLSDKQWEVLERIAEKV